MNKTIDFSLRTRYYGYISLTLHTIAAYQMENAALAVRAAEALDQGKTVTKQHICMGIETCFWAGRMEEALPEVFLDGAHNQDGIRAFLETVSADRLDEAHRSLLFCVVKDKDFESMAGTLADSGLFHRIAISPMRTVRSADAGMLKGIFDRHQVTEAEVFDNAEGALRELLACRQQGERIYAAGSLYLVGELKELISHDKF